ncbi:MAG: dTDP-4-dehydrorhamnose 3,5-epimerase family protein, partial [Bacteroidetes bacterium]|nr:dTDP-4-dehydrorhamnose 3,5-epimerase family protein [Fibrella sp.]
MELIETPLPGVFRIRNFTATDPRGTFVKPFNADAFRDSGLQSVFTESYYSVSHQHVIRGMHFQLPPHAHEKIVYVTQGQILDVIVDLRRQSPAYRQYVTLELNELGDSVYIPKGCAHGFLSR